MEAGLAGAGRRQPPGEPSAGGAWLPLCAARVAAHLLVGNGPAWRAASTALAALGLGHPVTQKVLGGTATPEPCWLPVQIRALESVQRFMPEVSKLCPRPLPQSLLTVGCRDSAEHPAEEVREGQVLDQDMLDRCVAGQPPGFGGCHRDDPPDARCPARILPVEQDDVADPDVLSLGRPQQAVVGHEDHHGKLNLCWTQAHIATATTAVAGTGARNSGGTARWKALINLHKGASERTSVTGPPVSWKRSSSRLRAATKVFPWYAESSLVA